jgi:hypothetical protein
MTEDQLRAGQLLIRAGTVNNESAAGSDIRIFQDKYR